MSPTVDALSRGPKYISDPEEDSRLDYLASPELVDILTKFMLGGRSPQQVEEGVEHPLDPNRDRTTYLSQQPPPRDLLGSAMERGNPLAWMEQVQEPEDVPEAGLIEKIARKGPQLLEQLAIMAGSAKGAKGGTRMQWEPRFGAEKPRPASGSRRVKLRPGQLEPNQKQISDAESRLKNIAIDDPNLKAITERVRSQGLDFKDALPNVRVQNLFDRFNSGSITEGQLRSGLGEVLGVDPMVMDRVNIGLETSSPKPPVEPSPELVGALAAKGPSSGGGDTIRVYSGGTSAPSDFWSENPGRAASFGPNVWVVEIPRSVFEAGKAQAAKLGQPTKWDTVLPNEWVKKSSQVPSENLGR